MNSNASHAENEDRKQYKQLKSVFEWIMKQVTETSNLADVHWFRRELATNIQQKNCIFACL